MLMTAKQRNFPVVQASRGIISFGVPHSGCEFAFWGSLLPCTSYWRGSSSALLEYMYADGNSRKQLQEDLHSAYVTNWQDKGSNEIGATRICDFFEQIPERKFGFSIALVCHENAWFMLNASYSLKYRLLRPNMETLVSVLESSSTPITEA